MELQTKNDFVDKVEENLNPESATSASTFQNSINNKTSNGIITMNNSINTPNTNTSTNKLNLDALKALRKRIVKDKKFVEEKIITINNFYLDENPAYGLAYKEDIANAISNTNDTGFEGLVNLFHYISLGKRFKLSNLLKDRFGNPYYWAEVKEGMSDIGFKIPYFEGLDKILKTNNNFKYNISMDEILNSINEENNTIDENLSTEDSTIEVQ